MGLIINTVITFVISTVLGYCLNVIKGYKIKSKKEKANENVQNEALLYLLQSKLTDIYFMYEDKKAIPDYIYKNWKNLLAIYEKLDGDDYIHTLDEKMLTWSIIKTDVLGQ